MKIQIIQLNKDDDYISVRDRMSWNQTGYILLVWPKVSHVLDQRLEINLVKHHARNLGARLGFITQDADVRLRAHELHIPVFDHLHQAQEIHRWVDKQATDNLFRDRIQPDLERMWQLAHPRSATWLELPATRMIVFGISILALCALAIFVLPGATIFLDPQVEMQSVTLPITADHSYAEINLSSFHLSTYSQEVIVEASDSIVATGSTLIPDKSASGSLLFTNNSDHQVDIPKGTVVTTDNGDPVRFAITSTKEEILASGESVILTGQAMLPGTIGNLPPNSLVVIEGQPGQELSVTNPSATSGGTQASVPSPIPQDLQQLTKRLGDMLQTKGTGELQTLLSSGDILIIPSVKIAEVLDKTLTPSVGEPGRKLTLSMRVRLISQAISAEVLRDVATPILDANLPDGYSPLTDTILFSQSSSPSLDENESAQWTVRVERKVQTELSTINIIELIKGSAVRQAIERLSASLPLAKPAQVILSPSWWPRLPLVPMRIQVLQSVSR